MTPPNPQSPTTPKGVPGCNLPNRVAPSPTLQAAAEGAAREIIKQFSPPSTDSEMSELDIPWLSAIALRHFSFVEELEKQRNAAMADYDRVALTNAELRIDLARARAERDDLSKVAAERLEWHTESRRQRDTARQEASELRGEVERQTAIAGTFSKCAQTWRDKNDVLAAQLAAADEMAEALESLRDDAETRDEQMLPHSLPRASAALLAYQAARTQGGAGA